jgi:hypothetical protein
MEFLMTPPAFIHLTHPEMLISLLVRQLYAWLPNR